MNGLLKVLGWILIIGGFVGGIIAYWVVGSQEFVLALLARFVEDPFEYRSYFAVLSSVAILLMGCLMGILYLGLAAILQNGQSEKG